MDAVMDMGQCIAGCLWRLGASDCLLSLSVSRWASSTRLRPWLRLHRKHRGTRLVSAPTSKTQNWHRQPAWHSHGQSPANAFVLIFIVQELPAAFGVLVVQVALITTGQVSSAVSLTFRLIRTVVSGRHCFPGTSGLKVNRLSLHPLCSSCFDTFPLNKSCLS